MKRILSGYRRSAHGDIKFETELSLVTRGVTYAS